LHAEHVADRPHSQTLLPQWERLLKQAAVNWQALDGFAVGTGPGSFTGIRVVAATINGLNSVLQKPIYALDSLAILALQSGYSNPIWAIEDARANEAFIGCYHQGTTVIAPALIPWRTLNEHVQDLPVTCNQPQVSSITNLWINPDPTLRTQALEMLSKKIVLTSKLPRRIYPQYLQPTQAERTLQKQ